jgi:hypothetical protein
MPKGRRKSARRHLSRGRKRDNLTLELAAELQRLTFDIQSKLGVSARDRNRAYSMAQKARDRAPRPSDEVLSVTNGMTQILSAWRRNPRYVSGDGSPKILPIEGKGVTFQTLVGRYMPNMTVSEAVNFLVAHSDVRRHPAGRLALLGSPALIVDRAEAITLALIIQRLRRLARTVMTNQELPQQVKGTGRYERQVTGFMTKKEFEEFSQSIRGQLQDTVDHVDERVEEDRPEGGVRHECGLEVYLWADF